jgi:hypothetical protein
VVFRLKKILLELGELSIFGSLSVFLLALIGTADVWISWVSIEFLVIVGLSSLVWFRSAAILCKKLARLEDGTVAGTECKLSDT